MRDSLVTLNAPREVITHVFAALARDNFKTLHLTSPPPRCPSRQTRSSCVARRVVRVNTHNGEQAGDKFLPSARDTKIKSSRNGHYSNRQIVWTSNPRPLRGIPSVSQKCARARARARQGKIIPGDDKSTKSSHLHFTSRCLKPHSPHVTPQSTESLRKERRDAERSEARAAGQEERRGDRENGNYAEPMIAKKRERVPGRG